MKIFKWIIISIFLIALFAGLGVFLSYRQWEEDTFAQNENILCDSKVESEVVNIEEKVEEFVLSDSKTDFVVFTEEEILQILSTSLEDIQPVEKQDICILPSEGKWTLYLKYSLGKIKLPWLGLNVVKDDMETAEVYVKDIFIGGFTVPEFVSGKIKEKVNKGISDSIILLNENAFLGRIIKNIELLEDKVVIKGSV